MRMYVFPDTVKSTGLGRLFHGGEYIGFNESNESLVFSYQHVNSDYFALGGDSFRGDFKIYRCNRTGAYYLAKNDAPFKSWEELGDGRDFDFIFSHQNRLIYSRSNESRHEKKTKIKNIFTEQEVSLDSGLGRPVCAVGDVLLVSGGDALCAVDINSGQVLWQVPRPDVFDGKFLHHYGYFAGILKPVTGPREFFLADVSSGAMLLRAELDDRLGPFSTLLDNGNLLHLRTRKSLYTLNLDTLVLQSFPIDDGEVCGGFFTHGGCVYLTGKASAAGNAWIAAYDLEAGNKIAGHVFPHYKNICAPIRLGNYIAVELSNCTEIPSWCFKRFLVFKPTEFAALTPDVELEPIVVELQRELDDRDESSYRVVVPPGERFETFVWQLEIGAHSCGQAHGIHLNCETKPYDDDFAGQIVLDCRNRELDEDQKARVNAVAARVMDELDTFSYVDAIKQKAIRVVSDF